MKIALSVAILLIVFPFFGNGQALLSTKLEVQGIQIYEDLKVVNKYYYAPGNLQLHYERDGQPTFKLIQMRYTGTGVTGNQGEKRFMNIVQFKVVMDQPSNEDLKQILNELPKFSTLQPIPLENVQAFVVAPFKGKYNRIGEGSFQSEGKTGNNTKTSFWTERTFTVRLENHEAQLLWDMVEDDHIGISVSYAYYANLINDNVVDFETTDNNNLTQAINETVEEIKKADTIVTSLLIDANAFSLNIDIKKFPEVLIKKDLNEGIPPAYPALQVACYDFNNNLRPDLAMKTIEFKATGLSDNAVKLRAIKFLNVNKDLHTKQVRFPYAVNMTKPLRYRIKEYSNVGDLIDKGWVTLDSWMGILDITSQINDIKVERRTIEIELDLESMRENEVDKTEFIVYYNYLGDQYDQRIEFSIDDSVPLQQVSLLIDKDKPMRYSVIKTNKEKRFISKQKPISEDNYVYINFQE